eukprot:XP_019927055.1 PREDICTED: uncharacterized protein LOC105338436 [Crassostrea gigas]
MVSFFFHEPASLVVLIIQFHLLRSTYEECKEAINNAEDVKVCPRSKEEWDIAARRKNCSKQAVLAEGKNCTIQSKQLDYHCLINAFRNKFLEVCEPAKTIFGHCAEYNELGMVIQNHYSAECNQVFPKCDESYRSSDAYKYPDCYKLVIQIHASKDDPEIGYDTTNIIIPTLTAVIALCCLVIVLRCIRGRKLKQKKENDEDNFECLLDTVPENKGAESKPCIQYFCYKIDKFQHFYYFYKQVKEFLRRIRNKESENNDLIDVVFKHDFVKCGVIGEFTDEDLLLLPKGITNMKNENENHWEAVPGLCFQNNLPLQSVLEACHREGACNLILIKSHKDETDEVDDFIINVCRNKTNILEAIISCLEQPLCKMLQKWLNLYSEESDIRSDINALCKMRLNHDDETDIFEIPEDLKKYLSGNSDITSYAWMTDNTLQLYVKQTTDEMKLKDGLKELVPKFYAKCLVLIDKRKSMKRNTGDVVKRDDIEWNKTEKF